LSLFGELKRRNVFRAGIAYLIVSWVLAQVSDLVLDNIGAPDWVMQSILLVLALGLPLVIIFSWAFEVTPDGIKREADIERSSSITKHTGRKLDRSITVLLIVAVAYFFWESRYSENTPSSDQPEATQPAAVTQVDNTAEPAPTEPTDIEIDPHSIAVLPFDNRSDREQDEFFVEGIHDDLLTNLAKISALKVISRTSVTRYKDTQLPIPEIAEQLGVATIMEGAVQRAGNTVRINVQLIDAQTDEHLWAEIFDRELTTENLFAIQSEISNKIAEALKATLSLEEQQRVNDRPTENLAAYSAYQRGRQLIVRRTAETIDKALLEFQRAVEIDPDFALAWVGIAESAMLALEFSDMKRPQAYQLAGEASEKALSLNDQLGEAHLARAELLSDQREFRAEAEEAYKLAIKLSPGYALAWQWYARELVRRGDRLEEALELANKAAKLDPLSPSTQNQVISVLGKLGQYDEAEERLLRLIEQDPDFASSYEKMSTLKDDQSQFGQSIYWLHKAQALDPGNVAYVLIELWPSLSIGTTAEIDHLIERMNIMDPNSSTLHFMSIWANIFKDNYAAALESAHLFHQKTGSRPGGQGPRFVIQSLREDYVSARAASEVALPDYYDREKWQQAVLEHGRVDGCLVAWVMINTNDEKMGIDLAIQTIEYADKNPTDHIRVGNKKPSLCYMVLDRSDDALSSLEKLADNGEFQNWWLIKKHPAFKLLQHEPRFIAVDDTFKEMVTTQRQNLARLEAADTQ